MAADAALEPNDLGAERVVLGSLLTGAPLADVQLASADFYRPAHQHIYEAIAALASTARPVDAVAVLDELRRRGLLTGGIDGPYLHTCIEAVPASVNAGYYARIVAGMAERRAWLTHARRIMQAASNPGEELATVRELAGRPVSGTESATFNVIDLEPATEIVGIPAFLCDDKLYRGAVHTLTGPPDCGKTTLACWWMLQAVRAGGRVLFLDEEGGREIVTDKFQQLGARPGERIDYVPFPARAWNAADLAELGQLLTRRAPVIVAWDSSAAFLARAGLDENAAADVTRFYAQVLIPGARLHDAAVIVIDHDTKNSEPSRYARGSGAKLASTDVAYKIEPVTPFSKGSSGLSKLTITKDRRGWLHRSFEVAFNAEHDLEIEITEKAEGSEFRPTVVMHRVCEALKTAGGLSFRDIKARVRGKEETIKEALAILIDEGYIDRRKGPYNANIHELKKPFDG